MTESERLELNDVRSKLDVMVEYRLLCGWTVHDRRRYEELTATEAVLLSATA